MQPSFIHPTRIFPAPCAPARSRHASPACTDAVPTPAAASPLSIVLRESVIVVLPLIRAVPLGGGLRPPSEPPPRNRCAGKAGARKGNTSTSRSEQRIGHRTALR